MPAGLRCVELVERESQRDTVQRVDHVVGVDESGNTRDAPFVMAAVQCPRTAGETLAELLVDLGLEPWKSKSSSAPHGLDNETLSARVRTLVNRFQDYPITWHAVAGWEKYSKEQRGAIACIATSKAMTGGDGGTVPQYEGPAVLLHDGGDGLYGNNQLSLRRAATRQFRGFPDRITPVYVANLQNGDKMYPEITAADYIAGYIRSEIPQTGIESLPVDVERIDSSWKASDDPPTTLYQLRTRNRRRQQHKEARVAAWIEGRQPPDANAWNEQPLHTLAERIDSDVVREYILNEL
jgi:hypothetical protein